MIPTPCPPHPDPNINQPLPHLAHPHSFIITRQWTWHSRYKQNNQINVEVSGQLNNQLALVIWCGILSQHPLPPARHQPHLLIPSAQTLNQEKTKNSEMRSYFQQILLYCLGLCTQNPELQEVDLEPSTKRGSNKINMQKQGRNTQKKASCIVQPGLTYESQHLERQT